MKKLSEIPPASVECNELPEDKMSRRVRLARKLESAGHQTIACSRSIVTIERCEAEDPVPAEAARIWGMLRISIYPDPDVSDSEMPTVLYLAGSRYGHIDAIVQYMHEDGRSRVFELSESPIYSE